MLPIDGKDRSEIPNTKLSGLCAALKEEDVKVCWTFVLIKVNIRLRSVLGNDVEQRIRTHKCYGLCMRIKYIRVSFRTLMANGCGIMTKQPYSTMDTLRRNYQIKFAKIGTGPKTFVE